MLSLGAAQRPYKEVNNMIHKRKALITGAVLAAALALSACTPQGSGGGSGTKALSDIKVALVPGGAAAYFQPWIQAGLDAKADFGIGDVIFNETSEWDQTKQTAALNALGAQGYTAFGVFGVSATDINTTFSTLKKAGFATGSLASCPAADVNEADFCLSTDTGLAAYKATVEVIKAMGGSGNLVALSGDATDTNTVRRIEGVKKAVGETNGAVTLITTITDIEGDLQLAQKAVDDLLASKGAEIQGIVATTYNTAIATAQGLTTTGLPIKAVGTDDDPITLDAIKAGVLTGTVVQNPYGQGYIGTWAVANLQAGICTVNEPGFRVDSGSFLVTKDTIPTYDNDRKATTKEILKDFQTKYFTCAE
jgi:ribose transport system substrate-binding protein